MMTADFLPRKALLTPRVLNAYRTAGAVFAREGLDLVRKDPARQNAWLQTNQHFDGSSGSYQLNAAIEESIRQEAEALGEEATPYLISFVSNLLCSYLLPTPSDSELEAPPTEDNFLGWFFYNYGIVIDRPQDTRRVYFALYLAIRRGIEAEHHFVGGFWLSAFYLPEDPQSWVVGGGWVPTLNRMVVVIPGWNADYEPRFFLSFLHEYTHFLDCCVLGQNHILADPVEGQDVDLQYFSAASADRLGFARDQLDGRYLQAGLDGLKNNWWRSLDFISTEENSGQESFRRHYKNHSPAECLAELNASYLSRGRNREKLNDFCQQEKDWFHERFLVALKSQVHRMKQRPVFSG